jgi:hypothetical protein
MKKKFKQSGCGILLSFLLTVAAPAQEYDILHAGRHFRVLSLNDNPVELHYVRDGAESPVLLEAGVRSVFHPIPSGTMLTLFHGRNFDAQKPPKAAAEVSLGKRWKYPLVLIWAKKTEADSVMESIVIEDDPATFKAGSYCGVNLTEQACEFRIGDSVLALKPGASGLLPFRASKGAIPFVALVADDSGTMVPKNSARWAMQPSQRTLVVLSPATDPGGNPTVRRIQEALPIPQMEIAP